MKEIVLSILIAKAIISAVSFVWKGICPIMYDWLSKRFRLVNSGKGNLYVFGGRYHGTIILPSAINPFR